MDAVTLPHPADLPSAEIIELAAWRRARQAPERDPQTRDPYPWAYTFEAPERR